MEISKILQRASRYGSVRLARPITDRGYPSHGMGSRLWLGLVVVLIVQICATPLLAVVVLDDGTSMVFTNAIPAADPQPPYPAEPPAEADQTRVRDDDWLNPSMNSSYDNHGGSVAAGTTNLTWSMDFVTPAKPGTITRLLIPGRLDHFGFSDRITLIVRQGSTVVWSASGTGSGASQQWWPWSAWPGPRNYYGWLNIDLSNPIDFEASTSYTFELHGIETGDGTFNLRMTVNSTNSDSYPGKEETIQRMTIDGTFAPPRGTVVLIK